MRDKSLLLAATLAVWSIQARPTLAQENAPSLLTEWGMSISAGGGGEGFTDKDMRDSSGNCGAWNVRAQLGTRTPIAFEAAYIGSAQSIDALGLDQDAILLGTAVEGTVRVNILARSAWQPYAFAGGAWRRWNVTNADVNTSDVAEKDDVLEIPMGAGLAYRHRGFVADARGAFRLSTGEDMVPTSTTEGGGFQPMHRWSAMGSVGYEF
ncbi:MAG TPA: hypothetical protein VL172_21530 [Kofleriaceae bacterium]|jgi:hypothetical protein|nr:hypothetical protein [Kofleriaceae bacterium]